MLYRPLTLQLFAAEWAVGGGRPVGFHAVSILLYAVVTGLVYRLIQRAAAENGCDATNEHVLLQIE